MARKRGSAKSDDVSGKNPAYQAVDADGILRLRLLEFVATIGLMPHRSEEESSQTGLHGIFQTEGKTPAGMMRVFPEEIGAMGRLGKSTARCFRMDFPPYRVYCLPYFYYDGFHALLYVEENENFLAAWRARDSDLAPPVLPVLVGSSKDDLQVFLDCALHGAPD